MMKLRFLLLIVCGLSSGFVTATAYVAFISVLGIFPKFAERTKTARDCILYENCLMLGVIFSTLLQFFLTYESAGYEATKLPPTIISKMIICTMGLFGGIYTGFLIGGLSEVINVFPIFARKTRITKNIRYAITSLALGKGTFLLIESFITR